MPQAPDPDQFRTGRFSVRWDSRIHLVVEDLSRAPELEISIRASLLEWRELAEAIEASAAARDLNRG